MPLPEFCLLGFLAIYSKLFSVQLRFALMPWAVCILLCNVRFWSKWTSHQSRIYIILLVNALVIINERYEARRSRAFTHFDINNRRKGQKYLDMLSYVYVNLTMRRTNYL
jgi:hypothetical protein